MEKTTSILLGIELDDPIETILKETRYNVLEYTDSNFYNLTTILRNEPFQYFANMISRVASLSKSNVADCKCILRTLIKLSLIIKRADRYVWNNEMITKEQMKVVSFYLISAFLNLIEEYGLMALIDTNYNSDEGSPEQTKYLIYIAYEEILASDYIRGYVLENKIANDCLSIDDARKIYELLKENPNITNKKVFFDVEYQGSRSSKLGKEIIKFINYIKSQQTCQNANLENRYFEFCWLHYTSYD